MVPSTLNDSSSVTISPSSLPHLVLPPKGQWVRVRIPETFKPTYLPPTRFIVRCLSSAQDFDAMQAEMDAFYSIANFTREKRHKKGVIDDDRLIPGALFAAFVKDLRAWSRVVVKAPYGGLFSLTNWSQRDHHRRSSIVKIDVNEER